MLKIRALAFFILLLLFLQLSNLFTDSRCLSKADVSDENGSMNFPSDLKIGDLLFCDVKSDIQKIADMRGLSQIQSLPGYANDHIAMYVGNNNFIEATPYLFAPFKNEWIGVVITPYWFLKLWATNITFGYVETDQKIRNSAVEWAKKQIGKPYGENGFTCAELIFEAYKKQNFFLNFTWPYNNITYNAVTPGMIIRSDQVVLYSNILPIAEIDELPSYRYVHETIYFNAFNSKDLDGMIIRYNWDFGDGTYVEKYPSEGQQVTHVYRKPGEYTITLTVVDNAGGTNTDTATILIKEETDYVDDDEGDATEPDEDIPLNPGDEDDTQEIIGESDVGLSILIGMIFAIFLSIITLIFVIRK